MLVLTTPALACDLRGRVPMAPTVQDIPGAVRTAARRQRPSQRRRVPIRISVPAKCSTSGPARGPPVVFNALIANSSSRQEGSCEPPLRGRPPCGTRYPRSSSDSFSDRWAARRAWADSDCLLQQTWPTTTPSFSPTPVLRACCRFLALSASCCRSRIEVRKCATHPASHRISVSAT